MSTNGEKSEELSNFNIDSEGPLFDTNQIKIPPEMPEIMKQFTKAAIRTQPADLLFWSKAYFKALSSRELPPVKERFEIRMPIAGGLSREILEALHRQLGRKNRVKTSNLRAKWRDFCLDREHLRNLLKKAGLTNQEEVIWLEFLALACMSMNNTMTDTMIMICEILTKDPRGGPARIPFVIFEYLYRYLAKINGRIPLEQVDIAMTYLAKESNRNEGMIKPRNFLCPDCPPINELPASESMTNLYWKEEELGGEEEEEELPIHVRIEEESLPPIEETTPTQDFALLFKRRYHRWRKLH